MRHIYIFVILLLMAAFAVNADPIGNGSSSYTVIVKPGAPANPPESNKRPKEEPKHGRRTPGIQIMCTISTYDGVEFLNQETPEFLLYEIYSDSQNCVYAGCDEMEFVNFLMTLSGEFQLCFTTDANSYTGFISK